MTPEQRQELIRLLEVGEEISREWARELFPPEKREYELVCHGKEREEDIIADTLAVPLQPVRTFGKNGDDWHIMPVIMFSAHKLWCPSRIVVSTKRVVSMSPPGANGENHMGSPIQVAGKGESETRRTRQEICR